MKSVDNLLENDEQRVFAEGIGGSFTKWLKRLFSEYEIPGGTDSPAYKDFEKFVNDLREKGWDDGDVLQFLKGVIKKVPAGSGSGSTGGGSSYGGGGGSRGGESSGGSGGFGRGSTGGGGRRDDDEDDEDRGGRSGGRSRKSDDDLEDDDELDDLEGDVHDAIYDVLKKKYPSAAKKKLLSNSDKISKKFVKKFGDKLKRAAEAQRVEDFLEDEFPKLVKPRKEISAAISKIAKDYNEPTSPDSSTGTPSGGSGTTEVFNYSGAILGESAKERYRNYLALLEGSETINEAGWLGKLGSMLGIKDYKVANVEKNPHFRGMINFIKDLKANYDDADVYEFFKVMMKRLPRTSNTPEPEGRDDESRGSDSEDDREPTTDSTTDRDDESSRDEDPAKKLKERFESSENWSKIDDDLKQELIQKIDDNDLDGAKTQFEEIEENLRQNPSGKGRPTTPGGGGGAGGGEPGGPGGGGGGGGGGTLTPSQLQNKKDELYRKIQRNSEWQHLDDHTKDYIAQLIEDSENEEDLEGAKRQARRYGVLGESRDYLIERWVKMAKLI